MRGLHSFLKEGGGGASITPDSISFRLRGECGSGSVGARMSGGEGGTRKSEGEMGEKVVNTGNVLDMRGDMRLYKRGDIGGSGGARGRGGCSVIFVKQVIPSPWRTTP